MTDLQRRSVLVAVAGAFAGISGCGAFDYSRYRLLGFKRIELVSSEDEFVYRVELNTSAAGREREWEVFHEVVLVGFGADGSRVGAVELGAVDAGGEGPGPVEMVSTERAVLMTFVAREGPCDADTEIEIARFRSDGQWRVRDQRECGEGLPPEPLTPTSES